MHDTPQTSQSQQTPPNSPGPKSAGRNWLSNRNILIALYLLAVVFRLIYLFELKPMPTTEFPLMDEQYHVEWAREIIGGEFIGDEPFFRAPLYPYVLAGIMAITGDNIFVVRVIHCFIGAVIPLLIFLLGIKLFPRSVALGVAIVACIYPTFVYYDASLLITSLMVLLCTIILICMQRAEENPTPKRFIILGVMIGLAALARPNILFFVPALAVWLWVIVRPRLRNSRKHTAVSFGLTVVAAMVVIAPVTVRNYVNSGEFIPIAWQGGYNFYLGNNQEATGWSATAPGIRETWMGGYEDAINLATSKLGRQLMLSEVDNFWWDLGWDEIKSHPWEWIKLMSRKKLYLFNGYEIPNNQNLYLVTDYSSLANLLFARSPIFVPYGILAPLAILGIALSVRQWRKYLGMYLFLAAYVTSIVLFFVCARYRQPMIPVMLLFAGFAVYQVMHYVREKNWKIVAVCGVALIGVGYVCNMEVIPVDMNRERATNAFFLGSAYQQQSDFFQAERQYQKALEYDSTYVDALLNLGVMSAMYEELETAEARFTNALKIDPNNPQVLMNLGMVYLQTNRPQEAMRVLETARRFEKFDYNIHFRLGLVYHTLGMYEWAARCYRDALALKPNYKPAQDNLKRVEEIIRGGY